MRMFKVAKCDKCGKIFKYGYYLVTPYVCNTCEETIKNKVDNLLKI